MKSSEKELSSEENDKERKYMRKQLLQTKVQQKITDFHITEKTGQNTRTGRFISRFFSKGEVICS